jgi:hypothetical protein
MFGPAGGPWIAEIGRHGLRTAESCDRLKKLGPAITINLPPRSTLAPGDGQKRSNRCAKLAAANLLCYAPTNLAPANTSHMANSPQVYALAVRPVVSLVRLCALSGKEA